MLGGGVKSCGSCALFREGRVPDVGACMCATAVGRGGRHPMVCAATDATKCPDFRLRPRGAVRLAPAITHAAMDEKQGPSKEEMAAEAGKWAAPTLLGRRNAMGSLDKLGDKLFAELERLDALDLADADAAEMELRRAKSIVEVAGAVTANHATALSAARMMGEVGMAGAQTSMVRMLGAGGDA